MFNRRRPSSRAIPGPHVLEATTSCHAQVQLQRAWELVSDASTPMPGDDNVIEAGWLPGHQLEVGGIQYSVREESAGRLVGGLAQVVACDPLHRLSLTHLSTQVGATQTVEWTLEESSPVGVTVSWTLRVHVAQDLTETQLQAVQVRIEQEAARMRPMLEQGLF